jgi:hypothetical protein
MPPAKKGFARRNLERDLDGAVAAAASAGVDERAGASASEERPRRQAPRDPKGWRMPEAARVAAREAEAIVRRAAEGRIEEGVADDAQVVETPQRPRAVAAESAAAVLLRGAGTADVVPETDSPRASPAARRIDWRAGAGEADQPPRKKARGPAASVAPASAGHAGAAVAGWGRGRPAGSPARAERAAGGSVALGKGRGWAVTHDADGSEVCGDEESKEAVHPQPQPLRIWWDRAGDTCSQVLWVGAGEVCTVAGPCHLFVFKGSKGVAVRPPHHRCTRAVPAPALQGSRAENR